MNVTDPAFHLISPASPIYQVTHAHEGVQTTEQPSAPTRQMSTEDRLVIEWAIFIVAIAVIMWLLRGYVS